MPASLDILIAAASMVLGGAATSAESPVVVASAAQVVTASKTCARHFTAEDVDTAAIEAEGWKPFDEKSWPDRIFPAGMRFLSRGDGVLLGIAIAKGRPGCIIFARRAPSQSHDDMERDLTAEFAAPPVYKDTTPPRKTLWAIDDMLFLLTVDKLEPDAINLTIGTAEAARAPDDQTDHSGS
jgi:hypothetical protein